MSRPVEDPIFPPSRSGGERHEAAAPPAFLDTASLAPPGLPRRFYHFVQPAVEALFGFPALRSMYDAGMHPPFEPDVLCRRALDYLGANWEVSEEDARALAAVEGPLVLAANHPFGGIEFFALVQLMESVRPGGWKFLANDLLCSLQGFENHLIPLDPVGEGTAVRRKNARGLKKALQHLQGGGLLGLFPAGRVSHRHPELGGAVADRPWSPHLLQLVRRSGASLACLHIPGQNSNAFLRLPPKCPRLRALALCRELTCPPVSTVSIRLASLYSSLEAVRFAGDPRGAQKARAACYLREDRRTPRPPVPGTRENLPSVEEGPSPEAVQEELEELAGRKDARLPAHGRFDLYFLRGDAAPNALRALGRAREITFRAAGQGAGRPCDLSPEDHYYHHLLLWDRGGARLAGAYRVGMVEEILASHGPEGLYLDHVFHIHPRLYRRMGGAFELSRSFVLPEYQRDNGALAGLWKGLGAAALRHGIETLFGSVTISDAHHPATRALLVEYLRCNHSDTPEMRRLVRARNPFAPSTRYHRLIAEAWEGEAIGRLAPLIEEIEEGQRSIPPLMRYYCNLGAKFLQYHVEPSFQNALYCLLRIEVAQIPESYRKRFLSPPE